MCMTLLSREPFINTLVIRSVWIVWLKRSTPTIMREVCANCTKTRVASVVPWMHLKCLSQSLQHLSARVTASSREVNKTENKWTGHYEAVIWWLTVCLILEAASSSRWKLLDGKTQDWQMTGHCEVSKTCLCLWVSVVLFLPHNCRCALTRNNKSMYYTTADVKNSSNLYTEYWM